MLKHLSAGLVVMCLIVNGVSLAGPVTGPDEPQVTTAEEQEARELVKQFTLRVAETQDLSPVIKELYLGDFITRYKTYKVKDLAGPHIDLYFAPGLDYNSGLLTEADSQDWERFYVATNNFLLLTFIWAIKHSPDDPEKLKTTDMFPSTVIKLLNKNANLANMIVHKERSKPVSSVAEMRAASAILEQGVTMMREGLKGKPVIKDTEGLLKLIKEDELFKPRLEVVDEDFFGFPKGTRLLIVKTPLGLNLMLTPDAGRLKVFWTEIIAD